MFGKKDLLTGGRSRVIWIDFCRVYTAFWVVVRHTDRPVDSIAYLGDLFNYRSLIFFFFLMAGYFTHQPQKGEWLGIRRALQLLWPYLFWGVVAFYMIMPVTSAFDFTSVEGIQESIRIIGHSFYRALGIHSWAYYDLYNVPLWFLRVLMVLSLIAPLLCRIPGKILSVLVLFCFAASDILCFVDAETAHTVGAGGHAVSGLPYRLYESVLALGFFSGGILLRRFMSSDKLTDLLMEYAWAPVLAAVLLFPAVHFWHFSPPIMSSALVLVGVLCNMSTGCLAQKYLPRFSQYVASWGTAAFLIYVMHFPLLTVYRDVFAGTPLASGAAQSLLAPLVIVVFVLALYRVLKVISPWFLRVFALSK